MSSDDLTVFFRDSDYKLLKESTNVKYTPDYPPPSPHDYATVGACCIIYIYIFFIFDDYFGVISDRTTGARGGNEMKQSKVKTRYIGPRQVLPIIICYDIDEVDCEHAAYII